MKTSMIIDYRKSFALFVIAILATTNIFAQTQVKNERTREGIDVFLSQKTIENTELKRSKLLKNFGFSTSGVMVVATADRFYCIGYNTYVSRKVKGKKISSFCIIDEDVYFTSESTLYKIDTQNREQTVMKLPFSPQSLWAGKKLIYSSYYKKEGLLYAISPKEKIKKIIYKTDSPIICVEELGSLICVLTGKSLTIINIKDMEYREIPIDTKELGTPISMSADETRGIIYFSTNNGSYRISKGNVQKVCNETGQLCYDEDGLIIFNSTDPYLIRLQSNLLYGPPTIGVPIEIK